MGVPVVTLAGTNHRSRVGKTLLECVGLGDLVADTPDRYVGIAAGLAGDPDRLAERRRGLRGAVARSPLTDEAAFTVGLEAAYRSIWRDWCGCQGKR